MSIATMNWALAQRLESCQLQILLYVIADSADPNGLTRHCDPDYMADRARMSRPTMFRRLGELEASGLLTRRKFYSEKGAPIYEIWLNLEAHVDAPIRRRRREDDDEEAGGEAAGADGAEPAETAAGAATEIPESQPETLVRRPKSHLEHDQSLTRETFIYPPISKTLPLPPLRGGSPAASLSKKEAEQSDKREGLWLQFVQGYPGIAAMDQQAARQELEALSIEDAEWAASVLPQLKTELKKAGGRPPKNAHLWLRKAMFRNFPKAKIEPPPPDGVWIAMGSDQDRALRLICGLTDAITPRVRTRPDGAMGYWHPREVGPDLLAMRRYAADSPFRWPLLPRGSAEFAAWQERFAQWVRRPRREEPGEEGIRVPCRWPPKKDGTIYDDDAMDANQEGTAA